MDNLLLAQRFKDLKLAQMEPYQYEGGRLAREMTHQTTTPYGQFQQEYPQLDQYARDVASGRIAMQGLQRLSDDLERAHTDPSALLDYLGAGGIAKVGGLVGMAAKHGSPHMSPRIYDTSGMSKNESMEFIRDRADRLSKMIKNSGFDVSVRHSGSAAGPSSYISVSDPKTGSYLRHDIRLSNHSKGGLNTLDVIDVTDDYFDDILSRLSVLKNSKKTIDRPVIQKDVDKKLLKKAIQKKKKGYSMSNIERNMIDSLTDKEISEILGK